MRHRRSIPPRVPASGRWPTVTKLHDGSCQQGYQHEVFVFDGEDDLLEVVLPFIDEGIAAGEPVIIAATAVIDDVIRARYAEADGVEFVPKVRLSPAAALQTYQKVFQALTDSGSPCIRVVGDVPNPATGALWDNWARYEAAANRAYADYPVRGMCLYDRRSTPEHVIEDVLRTHPRVVLPGGEVVENPDYEDPATFFARQRRYLPDPVELRPPDRDVVVEAPAEARRTVTELGAESTLSQDEYEGLINAISEVATNALRHGVAPVTVRAWHADDRVVVIVRDCGTGPSEEYLGLAPLDRAPGEGGYGLWLAHLLTADVSMRRHEGGFDVRLVAGSPFVAP